MLRRSRIAPPALEPLRRPATVEAPAPRERLDDDRERDAQSALERQWRGFRRELLISNQL